MICPVEDCGKKMPGNVVAAHIKKQHPYYIPTVKEEIAPQEEGVKVEEVGLTQPITSKPVEPIVEEGMVVLKSADGRKLEVSINAQNWSGIEISVSKDQANSVRRELIRGGFYLKD